MNNDTTETTEPWLVELLVHSDPGPLVRKHLSLAKVLVLSRVCKSLHKLGLDETTRARSYCTAASAESEAQAESADLYVRAPSLCSENAACDGYLLMLAYLHE